MILAMDKFLRTRLSGQRFPDKDFRTSISGLKNKVDGRIMGNDAQAHIQGEISSSKWQDQPNNACNLNISRVEVDDYPTGRVGPLTKGGKDDTGWRGRQYFRPKVSGQGFPD